MPSKKNRKVPRSMINLLKNIFKQKKIELVPTGINLLEPIKFEYHPHFFDE